MQCDVHGPVAHRPVSLEQELHHVVPRHWQDLWAPATAPFPGRYDSFGVHQALWDARTVLVSPTCHRNVHMWLVAIMRTLAHVAAPAADHVAHASVVVWQASKRRDRMGKQEVACATLAPLRFIEAGGDVAFLTARKEWGAA